MTATVPAFSLQAWAKLNLCLEIGPVAPNGLHEIRSVMADLAIADELTFAPGGARFHVMCDDPSIPENANSARRAADALNIELPPIGISVKKRIPTQAGLGGGSADAAAALRGLAAVLAATGVTLDETALAAAAARTGSDVPACLVKGLKIVGGTGGIVTPITAAPPAWGVLLLKPEVGVATAEAYALVDRERAHAGPAAPTPPWPKVPSMVAAMQRALERRDFAQFCAAVHNDFQAVMERAYPQIAAARERVGRAGATATALCGSGSCVAGFFPTVPDAEKALPQLKASAREWAAATGFAHAG